MSIARPPPRWNPAMSTRTCFKHLRARAGAVASTIRRSWLGRRDWKKGLVRLLLCTSAFAAVLASAGFYHVYFDRNSLPDLGQFTRLSSQRSGISTMPAASPLRRWRQNPSRSADTRKFHPLFGTRSWPRRTKTSSHIPELTTQDSLVCFTN